MNEKVKTEDSVPGTVCELERKLFTPILRLVVFPEEHLRNSYSKKSANCLN